MDKGAIFPLFYLPPISFFGKLSQYREQAFVEKFEHFPKQTYRNRATIQSPNGKLDLTVPVVKGSRTHTQMMDVKISYDFNWQRLHWMSLQTSYRSSAYFEFYEDELAPFYEKRWDFLFDFNLELLTLLLKQLKLTVPLAFTTEYQAEYPGMADFRDAMSPKKPEPLDQKQYFQVFEEQTGFLSNLSAVDLLFSQGPQSKNYW